MKWNILIVLVLLAALTIVLGPAQPVQAAEFRNRFIQVSAGQWHTCALSEDGIISCWGDDGGTGRTKPPEGVLFKQVEVGSWHSCGLTRDGNILCWGEEDGGRVFDVPASFGTFKQISVADWHGCGLRTDGTVDCWGKPDGDRTLDPPGTFTQISSANWHNCGVLTDGHAYCWGNEDEGRKTPPVDVHFQKVSAAPWHSCGLTTEKTIVCWGDNDEGRAQMPGWDYLSTTGCPYAAEYHVYYDISAGWWHTCATAMHTCSDYSNLEKKVHCWGSNDDGRIFGGPSFYLNVSPFENDFFFIDAGPRHTCAIMLDAPPFYYHNGTITCWGNNDQGQAPSRVYMQTGPDYYVNSTDSTNDHACNSLHCTLLEAIETANGVSTPSIIHLTAGSVYTLQEDAGGGAGLRIKTPITINGNGAIIQRGTADIRMAVVDSTLTLNNVTVRNFQTSKLHGGVIYNNGTVTIRGSTLVNNSALRGGALLNNGTLTIANSTLTNNTAAYYGGAVANYASRILTVLSSTFANNNSPDGGALKNDGTLTLKNTLLVKGTSGANCAGNAPESGSISNMADDSSCGSSVMARTTVQINLGGLASNGGNTQTKALLTGSVAIDQGNAAACQEPGWPWIDQRGYNRFADGPDTDTVEQCDIGAFENGSNSVVQGPVDDTTAPLVSIQQAPEMPDGANGWYRSPVTLQPSAFDEFEVIDLRCALDPAIPPATFDDLPEERCPFLEGAAVSVDGPHTFYAAALDINGNRSEVLSAGFQLDATPTVITCPAAGPFLLHSGDQFVGPAGVDASVSGLDEAASTLSGIVMADSVGSKILTFTAFDLAGNSASQACSYNVIYDFAGFYPPVEPAPALNEAKAGQSIPLKFSLAGDQGLEVIAAGSPVSQPVACDTLEPVGPLEAANPAGKSGLSYDPLTGWYNYVWKTDKAWAGTCQALTIELLDGTQHLVYFQFK